MHSTSWEVESREGWDLEEREAFTGAQAVERKTLLKSMPGKRKEISKNMTFVSSRSFQSETYKECLLNGRFHLITESLLRLLKNILGEICPKNVLIL